MNNKNLILSLLALLVAAIAVYAFVSAGTAANRDANVAATSTVSIATSSADAKPDAAKPGSGTPKPGTPAPARTSVTLALGEEGGALGVLIKPTNVVEDSRCPAAVECVWAGALRVNVILTTNGGTVTRAMEVGKPESIPGGQTVTITSATPAAVPGGTPKADSYRFTFKVSAE